MKLLEQIEKALKEVYQGKIILYWDGKTHTLIKCGSTAGVMDSLEDGKFYRDARDRIGILIEYVKAVEKYHKEYFGTKESPYMGSLEAINEAWADMQEAREKLGLYE